MNDAHMLAAIASRRHSLREEWCVPAVPAEHHSIIQKIPGYAAFSKAWFQPLLVDQRNEYFVLCTIMMLLTVLVSGIALMQSFWWVGAAIHIALVLAYVGSFTSILHNTSHKAIYKPRFHALNMIIPYVLAPFFGQTWNTYYYHHVKHHHVYNNGPDDISSTLAYQRDSFIDFVCYFSRFFFLVAYDLPKFYWSRGQYYECFVTLFGEISSLSVMYIAFCANPLGALAVLIAPFAIVRFGMMSGNWAQHAFIDPADPQCDFKSSTVCVNHAYNLDAFNDGYHTSHHLNPLRHWTEHPTHMIKDLARYNAGGGIVLKDIDFLGVWVLLMTHNYTALARRYVHIGPITLTTVEVITLLKSRLKSFTPAELKAAYPVRKERAN